MDPALLAVEGPGWARLGWLAVLLVGLPLLGRARVEDPEGIPRRLLYLSIAFSLWVLAALMAAAAWAGGLTPRELGLALPPLRALAGWTAGTAGAGILLLWALLAAQARAGDAEAPIVAHLMPRGRAQGWMFAGVSLTAGICEEWLFRGFALAALARILGSGWAAAVVQAVPFGLVHAYQGRWGGLRATLLGLLLAAPPLLAGSILPSMAAHFLLDLAAALWLWPRFEARLAPLPRTAGPGDGGTQGPAGWYRVP